MNIIRVANVEAKEESKARARPREILQIFMHFAAAAPRISLNKTST
jgi:hypothetical protein